MIEKFIRPFLFCLIVFTLGTTFVLGNSSDDGVWKEVGERPGKEASKSRVVVPEKYRVFTMDQILMRTILNSAPKEAEALSGISNAVLTLPMPDGTFERFQIIHSLVVEQELADKFPELGQTFRGQGIDDPSATVRLDFLPNGFHAMVLSSRGTIMLDPYAADDTQNYISYFKRDVSKPSNFACEFDMQNSIETLIRPRKMDLHQFVPDARVDAPAVISGANLRTYRIAIAATGEYTATAGGTIAGALAAQVLIMNRVNGIYERDVAIRMVIVANNNLIVYTNGSTDPYTNNDGLSMLGENQTNIDNVIGVANYDIGHVFSTGGGGVATVSGVCGGNKARGVTGLSMPVGDVFAIDYVAHEVGHQWSAFHTFNGGTDLCSGANRSSGSAYEPGSGITILGYAGICGSQNLAANSIDSFHVKSLESIVSFSQSGGGSACGISTPTGNTPPIVNVVGGPSFNIPKLTPFTLTAEATDANGDSITYDWQQYDLGAVTTAVPNTDSDGTARPIFRVFSPTTNPSRTFPRMQYILNNGNVPPATTGAFLTGEMLPAIERIMNFQVIARDNRLDGGGINTATAVVNVAATGPFRVSQPNNNITWYNGSAPVVTWDVGGSNGAPVNVANVRILLSTDGGNTFPIVLKESTPNDGSEAVESPILDSSIARIKIEAIGNIFFDISDTNFTISSVTASNGPISGRITTAGGRGVGKVYVVLSGGEPVVTKLALTNPFGYYSFDAVSFGQTYTITPTPRKGVTFSPVNIVRSHDSSATGVDFTAN